MRLMICDIYNLFGEADKKKNSKDTKFQDPWRGGRDYS